MKGKIIGNIFYYNEDKYNIIKNRIALINDIIITAPELLKIKEDNHTPIYTPFVVTSSRKNLIFFHNELYLKYMDDYLDHNEYYIIEPIKTTKVKTGENIIIKKFLGIPYKTEITYNYDYIE